LTCSIWDSSCHNSPVSIADSQRSMVSGIMEQLPYLTNHHKDFANNHAFIVSVFLMYHVWVEWHFLLLGEDGGVVLLGFPHSVSIYYFLSIFHIFSPYFIFSIHYILYKNSTKIDKLKTLKKSLATLQSWQKVDKKLEGFGTMSSEFSLDCQSIRNQYYTLYQLEQKVPIDSRRSD